MTVSFSLGSSTPVTSGVTDVAVADLNSDGAADVVATTGSGDIDIALGDNEGNLSLAHDYPGGSGEGIPVLADLNGDGIPDLIVPYMGNGPYGATGVNVLIGNGDGSFQSSYNYAGGLYEYPDTAAAADVNGDGIPDLIVGNAGGGGEILLGDGHGSFSVASDFEAGQQILSVTTADLNGDGAPDIVAANGTANGGSVDILLNDGHGDFSAPVHYPAGPSTSFVTVADVNGDGIDDILSLAHNNTSSTLDIFLGSADGSFSAPISYSRLGYSLAVADLDGDGHPDLVVAGGHDGTEILLGDGTGHFSAPINYDNYVYSNYPVSVAVADMNGDGRPDIVVGNQNGDTLDVLLNDGSSACYLPDVLVRTPDGESAIADLSIGDPVVTVSGAVRRIKWVGRRAYAAPFAARNPAVWPVTIGAGALAQGIPARDLRVSPNHALFLHGVLIEARLLVNDTTITHAPPMGGVEYLNLELDSHDVILANGTPAETFLACEGRGRFQNAVEYAALYPNEAPAAEPVFYARRTDDGPALTAARQQVAERAGCLVAQAGLGRLEGTVHRADRHGLAGWVRDVDAPGVPVQLDVLVDGVEVMRLVANRHSSGVDACSYELRWPTPLDGARHVVSLQRTSDGAAVPGAPVVVDEARGLEAGAAMLAGLRATANATTLDHALAFLLEQADALLSNGAEDARDARRTRFHVNPDVRVA